MNESFLSFLRTLIISITIFLALFNLTSDKSYAKDKLSEYKSLQEQTVLISNSSTIFPFGCENERESGRCEDKVGKLPPLNFSLTGTGTFVNFKDKISVLTVAHVCKEHAIPKFVELGLTKVFLSVKTTITLSSKNYTGEANIEKIDKENDLCILSFDNEKILQKIEIPKIAEVAPERGTKIKYAGAPHGMMSNDFMLTYEGTYAGVGEGSHILAIPCTGGTSGSSVRNEDFEVFSVIKQVHAKFENVCFGVNIEDIRKFLEIY